MNRIYVTGMTLVEMMIAIAIVGILAAVSVPSYQYFFDQVRNDVVEEQANLLRLPVAKCVKRQLSLGAQDFSACDAGAFDIPAEQTAQLAGSVISCINVVDGIIHINAIIGNTTTASYAILLTPRIENRRVVFDQQVAFADVNIGNSILGACDGS